MKHDTIDVLEVTTKNKNEQCPLSQLQASAVIHNLNSMSEDINALEVSTAIVEETVSKMVLENAKQNGFKQAAGFWFKAGAITMTIVLVGLLLIMLALLIGGVDLVSFLGFIITE